MVSCTFLLSFACTGIHAQEAMVTPDGNLSANVTTENSSMEEGGQQAYEISVVDGFQENYGIDLTMTPYHYSASNFLILKIENIQNEHMSYQLQDRNGKIVDSRRLNNKQTNISLKNFDPDIYLLEVVIDQKDVKTFKIIKTTNNEL